MEPTQQRRRRAQQSAQVRRPQYPDDAPRPQYPQYQQPYGGAYPSSDAQPGGGQYAPQNGGQYAPQYPQYSQPYAQQVPPQYASPSSVYQRGQGEYPPGGNPPDYDGPVHRRRSREAVWLLVIIGCIALLTLGGFWVSSIYSGHYPAFRRKVEAMDKNTFYDGVHIDGVHIGGLTIMEARRALQQTVVSGDQQYALSVTIDGKTWRITQNELPLTRNIDAVLQEAFSIGRQGTLSTLQSSMTPFEYRYQTRQAVSQNGAFLYTQVTYDKATVRQLAETLAARVSTPARDASVYSFDFNTRGFQFMPEQAGQALSSDEIYSAIIAQMDARNYNASITLYTHAQQPAVTLAQLQQSFGLISKYSTQTLASYNRNINIQLACQAVNGITVSSGQTFSFNETTGKRTVDKGYLPAGAIAQGRSYEETGGGVCQVSSTLFNAAAMANMKIVSSSPHAWPSTYVEPGRDATVDWQSYQTLGESLDMKFKNVSDYPIFIVAYMTGSNLNRACTCTVEIYGVALADGVRIELETQLTRTVPMPTPAPPEYAEADATHAAGTYEVVRKGREGYTYETYRVYYQNGAAVRRELLRTSNYKAYSELIRYYQ